jgi:uncharacterized protein (TIGR04168 family)
MQPESRSSPAAGALRIGLVGDLHGAFDPTDAAQLDAEGYERILFVGDLGPGTLEADRQVARAIARLRTPVMVMPGNNDCANAPTLRAELGHQRGLASLMQKSGAKHRSPLLQASAKVTWCGYGLHPLPVGASGVTLVSGRPYSMGGAEVAFADELRVRHAIGSMAESTDRLIALVDEVPTPSVVFLAHNGPTGLGGERDAPWGNDFASEASDHGDPDLRAAVDRAHARGLRVLGVIAGHMHHRLRGGGTRRWLERRGEVLFVNPAQVPRVVAERTGVRRHHVEMRLSEHRLEVEERWLDDDG